MLADGGFGNPQTLGNLSIKHALRTQRNNGLSLFGVGEWVGGVVVLVG